MNRLILIFCFCLYSQFIAAAELSGVSVKDTISTDSGQVLILNGLGLREKLWVDVYVGSLYLVRKSDNVDEILSMAQPWRIQLDFVYKEVTSKKLIGAWREGFEKNQSAAVLEQLNARIDQFYQYFATDAHAGDQYSLDYLPAQGTRVSLNGKLLGVIRGDDFKQALLAIWLGKHPADKGLKRGMLGL